MVPKKEHNDLAPEKLIQDSFNAIQDGVSENNRDWYRTLTKDVPLLITRISPDGKVTYVNDASHQVIGKPLEKIIGQDFFSLVPSGYRELIREDLYSLTPERPLVTYEHLNHSRLLRWKNRAIFDDKGCLKEFFTIGEDITEQREVEDKLRESEARNRALVEAIPDHIFRYSKDGRYLDAEIKDGRLLTEKGRIFFQSDTLIGSRIADILEPEIADQVLNGISTTLEIGELQIINYSYLIEERERIFEARMVSIGSDEVVSIVRDVTDQKEIEEAHQKQFHFKNMVAEISSTFVDMPVERIDDALNYALKLSGEFFAADRVYLFRFSEDGRFMNRTHEWCAEGMESQMERNQNISAENTPWWVEKIHISDYVYIPDVKALPPEAEKDKEDFLIEEIKSMLTIPMVKDGRSVGFFGFDAVREKRGWTEQQIALLKIVVETITAAIIKQETEEALIESEERYREILVTIEEAYYETDLAGNITFYNEAGFRMFGGYSAEEAIGLSYHKLYKDPKAAYKVFHRVFLTGKPEKGLVLEMVRKDGSTDTLPP